MAKTLRIRTATGWTTKPAADIPANRLTAGEVDDNFLALEADLAAMKTAFSLGTTLTGAVTMTATNGAVQYGTVTGAVTWTFAGAAAAGTITAVTMELTNGGSAAQTWPASVKWDGGVAPTLTAAGLDILEFYTRDGGTTWRGFLAAKDSK